jgi:hypothetical protein
VVGAAVAELKALGDGVKDIAREIIDAAKRRSAQERAGGANVVALPKRTAVHTTEALDAAAAVPPADEIAQSAMKRAVNDVDWEALVEAAKAAPPSPIWHPPKPRIPNY